MSAGIDAVAPILADAVPRPPVSSLQPRAVSAAAADFSSILMSGLKSVDAKLATADSLVRRFALDESVPVHQVSFALEEARLAVELAMQVRGRLVDSYRELMAMQL